VVVLLAGLVAAHPAFGGTIYMEAGDAGQSLATAQLVASMPPGTTLTNIQGTLEAFSAGFGADIYKIFLTGGQTFSATTDSNSTNFFDTQLFLFDSTGLGVYANDDDPNNPPQSTLPAGITFTPSVSGIYYLAISGTGFMPVSAGGFIFPVSGGFLDQSGGIQNAVGATGPGGASPLSGWSSSSSEVGAYDIALTGAQFLAAPEPGAEWLVAGGLALVGVIRRYRRSPRS